MILEMRYVVAHEIVERRGLVFRDSLPRYLVQIVACARATALLFWSLCNDVQQVQVKALPESDEQRPGLAVIVLRFDPRLLLVTRKDKLVAELRADESLVIVRGRIYEMSYYLFGGPLPLCAWPFALRLWNQEQTLVSIFHGSSEIFEHVFHGFQIAPI